MYNYETERTWVFTKKGQIQFLKIRDRINALLSNAGAFNMQGATKECSGESWSMMACVDRLLELGEIREISRNSDTPGQYRVFVKKGE